MAHGHDRNHPGNNSHHHEGCDHDCQTCGASPNSGLAACPYCNAAYPGIAAGARCPGCNCLNAAGRTVCAHCNGSLTRACVFCGAASLLDLPACTRCHEPFEGAEERKRARAAGAPVPHKADPTGAGIFSTLNNILKS